MYTNHSINLRRDKSTCILLYNESYTCPCWIVGPIGGNVTSNLNSVTNLNALDLEHPNLTSNVLTTVPKCASFDALNSLHLRQTILLDKILCCFCLFVCLFACLFVNTATGARASTDVLLVPVKHECIHGLMTLIGDLKQVIYIWTNIHDSLSNKCFFLIVCHLHEPLNWFVLLHRLH